MSTRDAVVGLDDVTKKCQCVLHVMLTYRGDPDLDKIRKVFDCNVMNSKHCDGNFVYEKLTHYYTFWMGYAFWRKEEDFRLEEHVRFYEGIENNNDRSITEDEVIKLMGPITTKPFPDKMSPWEVLIFPRFIPSKPQIHRCKDTIRVEGSEQDHKFALLFRVHHGISDGYSIMKLLMKNLSNEPLDRIPQSKDRKLPVYRSLMMYFGIILLSPYYHLKQFVIDVDRNEWHVREGKLTREWYAIRSERMDLRTLKDVSKRLNVSTTALLLAGFGGGIRRYLGKRKMPKVMRALAPMPWKGHPLNGLVNHWYISYGFTDVSLRFYGLSFLLLRTLGFLTIPIGIQSPLKRLKTAEQSVQLLKTSPILYTNFGTVPILLAPPSWLTDIWATNWMTTMVLSNFAGPDFPVKSFGEYYGEDVTFWLPQMRGSSSLGVAFLSYNGGVRITVTVDRRIVESCEDAGLLKGCIDEGMEEVMGYGDVMCRPEEVV